MEILERVKKCLILVIIELSQNIVLIKLEVGKKNDETASVAIKEFVG